MKVKIEFEGYDTESYGYQSGTIYKISRIPNANGENTFFEARIHTDATTYKVIKGMNGSATRFITNKSVLQRITGKAVGSAHTSYEEKNLHFSFFFLVQFYKNT